MMKTEKETIYTYNIFIFFINIHNLFLEIRKYRDQNKLLYSLNFKGSLSHEADTRIVNVFVLVQCTLQIFFIIILI